MSPAGCSLLPVNFCQACLILLLAIGALVRLTQWLALQASWRLTP